MDLTLSPVHRSIPRQGRRAAAFTEDGNNGANAAGAAAASNGGALFGSPLKNRPQTTDELFLDDSMPARRV